MRAVQEEGRTGWEVETVTWNDSTDGLLYSELTRFFWIFKVLWALAYIGGNSAQYFPPQL